MDIQWKNLVYHHIDRSTVIQIDLV